MRGPESEAGGEMRHAISPIRRPPWGHQAQKQIFLSMVYWSTGPIDPHFLLLIQISWSTGPTGPDSVYLARIPGLCGHVPPSNRFPPRPKTHHVSTPGGRIFPSRGVPDLCKTNEKPTFSPKTAPRPPKTTSRPPETIPRPPKTAPREPKTAARPPQDRPRPPQDRPRGFPEPPSLHTGPAAEAQPSDTAASPRRGHGWAV